MIFFVNLSILLAITAVVIILALSGTAIYYSLKVRTLEKTQQIENEKNKALQLEKQQATQNKLLDDCKFVAKALTANQCELTEACLRIITLRDHLPQSLQGQLQFKAMQAVYDATWELPTHQAYKDLDKQTRFKQDSLRLRTEAKHDEEVRKEATALIEIIDAINKPDQGPVKMMTSHMS
jgi:hypothetical protein